MAQLSASGVNLKVTPEQLIEESYQVERQIGRVRQHFESLQTLVSKSQGYWKGEAGEQYRKLYRSQEDNVEQILGRLAEHPVDLRTIARTYSSTETAVQQLIQSLPGDVLM